MANFSDQDTLIIDGARTPFGKFMGGLQGVTPTELATVAANGAIAKANLDTDTIDSVILGNVLQSASDAAYLPRHVGLNIGAPIESDALTVSRACGSALEAVIQGAKAIQLKESQVIVAGGTENMSMVPYVLRGARQGYRMGHQQVEDLLMQSLFDSKAGCVIGQTVDALAKEYEISRSEADAAAVQGQDKAFQAQQQGRYQEEIVPVSTQQQRTTAAIDRDESLRPDATNADLAKLPPLFGKEGVVTAGNSTGLTDGAAILTMTSGKAARTQNLRPLGRVLGWGVAGVPPKSMGIGPVPAAKKALAMAGLKLKDMDVIELNDSFSVQYLAVAKLMALDTDKVNPNGGAIALGHPMGATGARLILSALYHLRRSQKRYGLCTVCIGGGQGIAVVVEGLQH